VFRRGAGAFSTSHRPQVKSRDQWALARVKAFLKLVGTGQRKEAYNTDLDLLPKGHPQRSEKTAIETLTPKKYSHIDFTPPKGAQESAKRALEVRASKPPSQRGMTAVGIARARDLANGKTLSPDTVRRMKAYFDRHEVDKKGATWKDQGKGWQAWEGWGGNAGATWASKIVNQMNKADEASKMSEIIKGDSIALNESINEEDGLYVGKRFKTLALGPVSSRQTGDIIAEISQELLEEFARVFQERKDSDPVIIDWNHNSSPFTDGDKSPEASGALGKIIDIQLGEDGLYAVPAYTEKGKRIVEEHEGILYSSPEFITGEVYSRDGGELISKLGQLLAITLTPRPQQQADRIDFITLSESKKEIFMDKEDLKKLEADELISLIMQKDELVKRLEADIEQIKEDHAKMLTKEGSDLMEKEEDEKSMAESKEDSKDEKSMAEHKDEKEMMEQDNKSYSMSENLLAEFNALKEQVKQLKEEKQGMAREQAVNTLLSEGRITPADVEYANHAYDCSVNGDPKHWARLTSLPPVVQFKEVGHGKSQEALNAQSLHEKITARAKAENISFGEAMKLVSNENPSATNILIGR
jgi:phage I-like protein